MTRSALALFLISLPFSLPASATGPDALLQYADPAAQAIVGVEWSKVGQSKYAESLRTTFGDALGDIQGLAFIERLDRFIVSARAAEKGGTSLLLAFEGRFRFEDLRKTAAASKTKVQRYRNVEMLLAPGAGDGIGFAIAGDDTVLLGDRQSLMDAVDRSQNGSTDAAAGAAFRNAKLRSGTNDLWVAGSPEVFSSDGLASLQAALHGFGTNDPLAAELLRGLRAAESGGTLDVAFTLGAKQPPQTARKIRIYGLAEGMREVDFPE